MPGRQSTAPTFNQRPKAKKKNRSLHALAIASQQDPENFKVRRNRLGEVGDSTFKRKRDVPHNDAEDEIESQHMKRRRSVKKDRHGNVIEGGSDSEGNEWTLGQVDGDDDSDLDSDEAMGESDESRFESFTFGGSSKPAVSRNGRADKITTKYAVRELDLSETAVEGEYLTEDDTHLGKDAVDLATLLDKSDEENNDIALPALKVHRCSMKASGEDQATDSEGSMVEEGESTLSESQDEDDENISARLSKLQEFVTRMDSGDVSASSKPRMNDLQESTARSDFPQHQTKILPKTAHLGLENSIKPIRSKKKTSSKHAPKKVEVPLAKRQQDRLDRAVAYEKSKQVLERWIDTVKHNRRAEHLSFPLADPDAASVTGSKQIHLSKYSKPMTDLEREIHSILQASGLAPMGKKSEEDRLQAFEELQTNKMPLEEVLARRAELRKARELMFREEIRSKRIKKIKSKSYRRVHRREREKIASQDKDTLTAAGIDQSEDEQERIDRRRAEQRMGARHRESKFAKSVKETGRAAWDEDARVGVIEMAQKGEELKRRIQGKAVRTGSEDSLSSDTESTDNFTESDEESAQRRNQKIQRKLQRISHSDDPTQTENIWSKPSLSSMKFMQRANLHRKEQNDLEVETIRRELDSDVSNSEGDVPDGPGRRVYQPMQSRPATAAKPTKVALRNEFEEVLSDNDENERDWKGLSDEDVAIVIEQDRARPPAKNTRPRSADQDRKDLFDRNYQDVIASKVSDNPWLSGESRSSRSRKSLNSPGPVLISSNPINITAQVPKPNSSNPHKTQSSQLNDVSIATTSSHMQQALETQQLDDPTFSSSGEEAAATPRLASHVRNQELIKKAFAGDDVVATDFEAEKKATTRSEESQTLDNTLPGWGTWTGEGISRKQERRNAGRFVTETAGIAAEKRQDAKLARVIVNEKRVRKNSKYLASALPHPFETRAQYERSLRLPVGPEWTTKETFQGATKPRILLKAGVIAPMERPLL